MVQFARKSFIQQKMVKYTLGACPAAELPHRAPAKRENQFSWLLNPAMWVSGTIFGAG
jgi:hypothetical protein